MQKFPARIVVRSLRENSVDTWNEMSTVLMYFCCCKNGMNIYSPALMRLVWSVNRGLTTFLFLYISCTWLCAVVVRRRQCSMPWLCIFLLVLHYWVSKYDFHWLLVGSCFCKVPGEEDSRCVKECCSGTPEIWVPVYQHIEMSHYYTWRNKTWNIF